MRITLFPIAVLAVFGALSTLKAGPPLICHPYTIGDAQSLPWHNGKDWENPDPSYEVKNLKRDTLALLNESMPVLARMETMRRAAIYAAKNHDAGRQLLDALRERTGSGTSALAYFDYGYFAATLKQMEWKYREDLSGGVDGYPFVQKALALDPGSGEMEFAAAIMASFPSRPTERDEHLRKAREASGDGLLARNIADFNLR